MRGRYSNREGGGYQDNLETNSIFGASLSTLSTFKGSFTRRSPKRSQQLAERQERAEHREPLETCGLLRCDCRLSHRQGKGLTVYGPETLVHPKCNNENAGLSRVFVCSSLCCGVSGRVRRDSGRSGRGGWRGCRRPSRRAARGRRAPPPRRRCRT